MRKEMSKPTFFQMFVPGDSNANPHVFFPLFYKVVRINLLGGNHPLDIHFTFFLFKKNIQTKIEIPLEFYSVTGFFTNHELIKFLIVGIS